MAAKEATDIDLQSSRDDPTSAANAPIKTGGMFCLKIRCVFQVNDRLVEKDPDYTMRRCLDGSVRVYGYYFNNMTTYSETQIPLQAIHYIVDTECSG
ncbi:hypothetical protein DPV78_002336 [Talaromyces pinophilus]|nr:hypothetical protein DPV78_002336 [Talaromyces pinophilus]